MSCKKDPTRSRDMLAYIMHDCCVKCRTAFPGIDCTKCKTNRLAHRLDFIIKEEDSALMTALSILKDNKVAKDKEVAK